MVRITVSTLLIGHFEPRKKHYYGEWFYLSRQQGYNTNNFGRVAEPIGSTQW